MPLTRLTALLPGGEVPSLPECRRPAAHARRGAEKKPALGGLFRFSGGLVNQRSP